VLIPHKNPDGDAIGSSLGLWHYLREKGKEVTVVVPDNFPYFLDFLPGSDTIVVHEKNTEKTAEKIAGAEIIFCMDYSQLHRCGELEPLVRKASALLATIDHHPGPDPDFRFYWHETGSSSTCELVYSFIRNLDPGHTISIESATCLYTGLLTDTGCFRYSLRPQTFATAASLLETGVPADKIVTSIFDVNTPERLQLLGFALNEKLVILPEYRTAYISLSKADLDRFQLQKGDTEGLVNYTLSVKDVVFGVFFHEREPGKTKISFRSKGDFAVNEISGKYFGGGGHRNAAGGQLDAPVADTVEKFLQVLPQYKDALQSLDIV